MEWRGLSLGMCMAFFFGMEVGAGDCEGAACIARRVQSSNAGSAAWNAPSAFSKTPQWAAIGALLGSESSPTGNSGALFRKLCFWRCFLSWFGLLFCRPNNMNVCMRKSWEKPHAPTKHACCVEACVFWHLCATPLRNCTSQHCFVL